MGTYCAGRSQKTCGLVAHLYVFALRVSLLSLGGVFGDVDLLDVLDKIATFVRNLKTVFLRVGRHRFFIAGFHLRTLGLSLRKRRLFRGTHFSTLAGQIGLNSQLFLLQEL